MAKAGKDKPKAKKADEEAIKIVARNRRARFEFDLMESFEAGIVLTGTEVKSLRTGKASLEEATPASTATRSGSTGATSPNISRPTG